MTIYLLPTYWQIWPVVVRTWTWRQWVYQIRLGPLVIQFDEPRQAVAP